MTEIDLSEIRKGDRVRVWKNPDIRKGYTAHYVVDLEVVKTDSLKVWWKEPHGYVATAQIAKVELLERPEKKQVPGQAYRSTGTAPVLHFTILPDGRYYDHAARRVYTYSDFASDPLYDLVFDPTDAPALPNPLKPGVKVGDRVRRENPNGVTIEFEVHRVEGDRIYPRYGVNPQDRLPGFGYRADTFEVVGREVPDRLPAGTIVRQANRLYLRVEDGYIFLHNGDHFAGSDALERDLEQGVGEVIYLPER